MLACPSISRKKNFSQVRTVPPAVTNLTVNPHSVFALVTWAVPGNGGMPIQGFSLSYRRDKSHLSEEEQEKLQQDKVRGPVEQFCRH